MSEPSDTAESSVEILLQRYFSLCKVKDPEDDLQASQIEARRLLLAAERLLISRNENSTKIAAVKLLFGKNCYESEENYEAEESLTSVLSTLNTEETYEPNIWAIHFEALIMLGVVLCKRGKLEASLTYLEKAAMAFVPLEKIIENNPPVTPEGLLLGTESEMLLNYRIEHCQQLYTHALYYLAQVHLQLGHKEDATSYCQKTLARQLNNEKTLNSLDWAVNCASLAQVFLGEHKFQASIHYLSCALSMEDRIQQYKPEDYAEFHANMHRCIATLGLRLLESYVNSVSANSDQENSEAHVGYDFLRQKGLEKLDLDVHKIEDHFCSNPPSNYDEARDCFLLTQRSLLEARDTFFKLDTHCNDFIDITQNYSKLFKLMASIEPEASRGIAMHRRRIDMLSLLANRLNPQFYLLRYRQLVYEIAETYVRMVDLELGVVQNKRLRSIPSSKHEDRVNKFADFSIEFFKKYLNSLKQPFNDESQPLPDPLPVDELRPTICAYLSIGHMHSKKIAEETRDRINNLLKAQDCYKYIESYCDQHLEAFSKVKDEYDAATDTLNLMEVKLEAIRNGDL